MFLAVLLFAADFSLETQKDVAAPDEVAPAIVRLLERRCLRLKDGKGNTLAEVWLRASVTVEATDEQISNGLTYAEVPATTLLGVIRLPDSLIDYRKQKVPAGVYTLRLAIQPPTGDHMGTAPHAEFAILCSASEDRKAERMEAKTLIETSTKINSDHPSVMVLFPGHKDATPDPKLVDKGKGHQVLFAQMTAASAKGKKAILPVGFTLVGVSAAR
ncbi:MAG: hypothetical protein EBV06_11670 [Planctomycetia bacterium]|nr:hypothetical protein [Planctomycetia bacterium]